MMHKIESNFSKIPKYFFRLKAFSNHKRISNTSTPDTLERRKDQNQNSCVYNEFENSLSCQKSNISIGIIGGGLTAIYATSLLKQNLMMKRIHLVDTTNSLEGAMFDASFIDTSPKIKYFKKKFMKDALKDMDIIAILDESDFKMGNDTVYAQFMASVNFVRKTAEKMLNFCPTALVITFTHPVTSTLPLISEIYKSAGWWDPKRIIGSVALEAMRAESLTSRLLDLNPAYFTVPLAGGADACTTIPLFSASRPINEFTKTQVNILMHKFGTAEKELASTETEGPILSSATAVAKFLTTVTAGLSGHDKAIACAYVRSDTIPFCRFFTSELKFGPNGVEQNFGLPKVSPEQIFLIEKSVNLVNKYVNIGINEAHKKEKVQAIN